MLRPKHTPGPWKSTAEDQQHDLGENFYILGGPDYACHIAEMLNADHFPCIPDDEVEDYEIEVEGNARLIAAAPELLDVAITLCNQFAQAGVNAVADSNDPHEMLHFKARALIAKVAGGQDENQPES